ncbi:MAG TPA: prolipoprotein diacylglyceryl transferase [Abditibacteriaceae bacterium]|nr:prolipoprotein diacylglyceryl transferase [Abditibacteriaceae bacterium]
MRPILAVIPQFPVAWLLPSLAITVVAALALAARNLTRPAVVGGIAAPSASPPAQRSQAILVPLLIAAAIGFVLWLWSRQPIKLHSYGFFLIVGFFAATWSACLEARRRGYDPNLILDLAMPILLVSILACRALFVLLNLDKFESFSEMLRVWDGGLSFHGALIGPLPVLGYFAWSRKIKFGMLCDLIAPSVFLGYALGRIGCFFNGCCYGAICDLPWAVQFPDEHNRNFLTPPSHPAQLYSSLLALVLFFVMQRAKLLPRFNRFSGQLTLLFFAFYAVERAFIEIFRNGVTAQTVFGMPWLTRAQFASVLGLIVIAIIWAVLARRATLQRSQDMPINSSTISPDPR